MKYKEKMTFDQWDIMEERLETVKNNGRITTFWPTEEEIEIMEENPKRWILLACYLYEHGDAPTTEEELLGKKMIQQFVNDHLELSDDASEAE